MKTRDALAANGLNSHTEAVEIAREVREGSANADAYLRTRMARAHNGLNSHVEALEVARLTALEEIDFSSYFKSRHNRANITNRSHTQALDIAKLAKQEINEYNSKPIIPCTLKLNVFNRLDYNHSELKNILEKKNYKVVSGKERRPDFTLTLSRQLIDSDAGSWFSPIFPACQYETKVVNAELFQRGELQTDLKSKKIKRAIICHDKFESPKFMNTEIKRINEVVSSIPACI